VQCLPSDTDGSCTKRNSLQDIRRTTNTAIDKDFKVGVGEHLALLEFVNNLYEDFDTGSGKFLISVIQESLAVGELMLFQDLRVVGRCIITGIIV
jgi:hypothetical protein